MTQDERNAVGASWALLAELYEKQVSPAALRMMVDSVSDLAAKDVLRALKRWPAVSKAGRHPFPNEVIELISPEPDQKFVAVELARKIDRAISRHGYTWEGGYFSVHGRYWEADVDGKTVHCDSFKSAIIYELGEIGWHAICSRGGWQYIHASQKEMDEGQFIAQLRDQVQASYALAKQGIDITRVLLPAKRGEGGLTRLCDSRGTGPWLEN